MMKKSTEKLMRLSDDPWRLGRDIFFEIYWTMSGDDHVMVCCPGQVVASYEKSDHGLVISHEINRKSDANIALP